MPTSPSGAAPRGFVPCELISVCRDGRDVNPRAAAECCFVYASLHKSCASDVNVRVGRHCTGTLVEMHL